MMKSFLVSFYSEFYKSRKTLAFWGAVLLPCILVVLISFGFYSNSKNFGQYPGFIAWIHFLGAVLGAMGMLIMPMFVVFIAYSIHSMEHKSQMWKSLFVLPLSKWGIYSAKFVFGLFLLFICLFLFAILQFGAGYFLSFLKPNDFKFNDYNILSEIIQIHFKLFLSGFGIYAIQFMLSLWWSDFLKPMGIGFIATIFGLIISNLKWKYAYLYPYSHSLKAIASMKGDHSGALQVHVFSQEIWVALAYSFVIYIVGYFLLTKKIIK